MPAADQQRRNPEHPQPVQRQRGRCFGIVLMIEYLYAQGHRKIGLIGGKPDQSRPSLSRLTGSQSAMFRLGLPFEMESSMPMPGFRCKADIPPWNTCSSTARILRQCLPCRT